MKKVLAIASIAVRNAIRSRVVISLAVILIAVVIGLPLTIKGDGTAEGYVRILLSYTLGFASFILALASLWAGCATVSAEIDEKQIQMVASKPVHGFQVWLGKWTGLTLINTLMLALCGIVTYGLLHRQALRLPEADARHLRESVLVCRQTLSPKPLDVDSQARALLKTRIDRNELPAGVPPSDALDAIQRGLIMQAFTVAPGSVCAWSFELPANAERFSLKYRIQVSHADIVRVKGLWQTETFRQEVTIIPGVWQELSIPASGGRSFEVQYANTDESGVTVLFSPDDGLTALLPAGNFDTNFVRALLIIWIHLAFLTALGVTAGSLFSMPVASFVSLYAVILLQTVDYVSQLSREERVVPWAEAHGGAADAINSALHVFFKALNFVLQPLHGADPLGALSSGQLVSWAWVGHDALLKLLLYGGVLAVSGVYIFNRRELALPS